MVCSVRILNIDATPVHERGHGRTLKTTSCMLIFTAPNLNCTFRDIVPFEQVKSNFNYKTDEKRVLNFENVVTDEDNIRQDMSIDVYGRKEKQEAEEAAAAETTPEDTDPEEDEEEDDLESFLAA